MADRPLLPGKLIVAMTVGAWVINETSAASISAKLVYR